MLLEEKLLKKNRPLEGLDNWRIVWHMLWQIAWPRLLFNRCPSGCPLHVVVPGARVLVSNYIDVSRRNVRLLTGGHDRFRVLLLNRLLNDLCCTLLPEFLVVTCGGGCFF